MRAILVSLRFAKRKKIPKPGATSIKKTDLYQLEVMICYTNSGLRPAASYTYLPAIKYKKACFVC